LDAWIILPFKVCMMSHGDVLAKAQSEAFTWETTDWDGSHSEVPIQFEDEAHLRPVATPK
jgi:hypothetical protein